MNRFMGRGGLSHTRTVVYVLIICFAVGFVYLIVARDMRFFRVPTGSMIPTILPDEFLVTLRADEYRRGDIVILEDPATPGGYLCKRIVGFGGDVLWVQGGALYLNGSYVSEPYLPEPIDYRLGRYEVRAGEVFVLGDNRNWSVDSHNWNENPEGARQVGGIAEDSIVGLVRYVYLPLRRARPVKPYPLTSVVELEEAGAVGIRAGHRVQ